MRSLPVNVLYYGRDDPLPERHSLVAGALSANFEEGQLVDIRWKGQEVLRRVYVAVRDRNWGTVPLRVSGLQLQWQAHSFSITFDARHSRGEIDFAWKAVIEGYSDGRLTFSMAGEALTSFMRSRIGFCLLHCARECAGKSFVVLRPDGGRTRGCFPELISQGQPIPGTEAMCAFAWELAPGLRGSIQFEGDVFQMEDQRNWTDATFKTFSTPLELPCPVEIPKGSRISQTIRISLEGTPSAITASPSEDVVITVGGKTVAPVPHIGLALAAGSCLTAREVRLLRALRLSHVRVDLTLWEPGWKAAFRRSVAEARRLGCPLEAAIFVSDSGEQELDVLRWAVEREGVGICRWLIFHQEELATSERWILLARKFLEFPNRSAQFGSGTNAGYWEVSSFRPPVNGLDFVCFSIQPQEHACDNASLVETLAIQGEVVENARRLHGGFPVVISPVTLKARFNPYATGSTNPVVAGELPPEVDVRQMSLFGAVWTLGSLQHLSEARVSSVTYYETIGWRGVMERETGPSLPAKFPSFAGAVFPLYHVLACVGEFAGGEIVPVHFNVRLRVCALALRKDGNQCLLVGNLTPYAVRVKVLGLPDKSAVMSMDESSAIEAMVEPERFRRVESRRKRPLTFELRPYSITIIRTSKY